MFYIYLYILKDMIESLKFAKGYPVVQVLLHPIISISILQLENSDFKDFEFIKNSVFFHFSTKKMCYRHERELFIFAFFIMHMKILF